MSEIPNAEVLEKIIANIRFMAAKSREVCLASLVDRLEVAAMEAEYQLTGVLPTLNPKPAK